MTIFACLRGVWDPKAPVSHRQGEKGTKGGHFSDRSVKKGREEYGGQGFLQRGERRRYIRSDALDVLPLRLE